MEAATASQQQPQQQGATTGAVAQAAGQLDLLGRGILASVAVVIDVLHAHVQGAAPRPLEADLRLGHGFVDERRLEVAMAIHLHPVALALAAGLPAQGQRAMRGFGWLQGGIDRFIAQLQRQCLAVAALVFVAIARGHPPEVLARRQGCARRRSVF